MTILPGYAFQRFVTLVSHRRAGLDRCPSQELRPPYVTSKDWTPTFVRIDGGARTFLRHGCKDTLDASASTDPDSATPCLRRGPGQRRYLSGALLSFDTNIEFVNGPLSVVVASTNGDYIVARFFEAVCHGTVPILVVMIDGTVRS